MAYNKDSNKGRSKREGRAFHKGNPRQDGKTFRKNRQRRDDKPFYKDRPKRDSKPLYKRQDIGPQKNTSSLMLETLKKNLYKYPNTVLKGTKLYTKNLIPGTTHFDIEETMTHEGHEYRYWDPQRSKLCAGLFSGLSQIGIKEGSHVLYLGASHGYTPSFVSDMIGEQGILYALDFAPRVVKDLVMLCERRSNMQPIMGDANHPQDYAGRINDVDIVFQDVAQKNQVEIFIRNCEAFLTQGGFGILALKARSVDVTRKPQDIFKETLKQLEEHFAVVDHKDISYYEKDHTVYIIKKK